MTVVDAGIVIAVLDADDVHHAEAVAALREVTVRRDRAVLPASAYAESMVQPSRQGRTDVVDRLVDEFPLHVAPATRAIARTAAALRARHGSQLRLPDALVVATAIDVGAARILTTDRGWPDVGVSVQEV